MTGADVEIGGIGLGVGGSGYDDVVVREVLKMSKCAQDHYDADNTMIAKMTMAITMMMVMIMVVAMMMVMTMIMTRTMQTTM